MLHELFAILDGKTFFIFLLFFDPGYVPDEELVEDEITSAEEDGPEINLSRPDVSSSKPEMNLFKSELEENSELDMEGSLSEVSLETGSESEEEEVFERFNQIQMYKPEIVDQNEPDMESFVENSNLESSKVFQVSLESTDKDKPYRSEQLELKKVEEISSVKESSNNDLEKLEQNGIKNQTCKKLNKVPPELKYSEMDQQNLESLREAQTVWESSDDEHPVWESSEGDQPVWESSDQEQQPVESIPPKIEIEKPEEEESKALEGKGLFINNITQI